MTKQDWKLESYDYDLPQELIAQNPTNRRDESRLLHLPLKGGELSHHQFPEILDLLPAECCLVLNNTRVLPARLPGHRSGGGEIEALLVDQVFPGTWSALVRKAGRIKPGERLLFCEEYHRETSNALHGSFNQCRQHFADKFRGASSLDFISI